MNSRAVAIQSGVFLEHEFAATARKVCCARWLRSGGLRVRRQKLDSIVLSTLIPIFGLLYETKFGPQVILTFGLLR
jgi:hypothetical protein